MLGQLQEGCWWEGGLGVCFPSEGHVRHLGINSVGEVLGFAGVQEGDSGEVRPVHRDRNVHPPGRAMLLAVTSVRHRLAWGLETMGEASVGLCSHPQGRAGPTGIPQGWLEGDFVPAAFLLQGRGFGVGSGTW